MNNTKEKELERRENEVLNYLLDNWNSTDTEVKLNYLRLLVKKYYEAKNEHS